MSEGNCAYDRNEYSVMEGKIADILSFCSMIEFGDVNLTEEEKVFQNELNREVLLLCDHLPGSVRTEAVLFLMKYLHTSFNSGLNFVNYFYTPAWSILFWILQSLPDNRDPDSVYMKYAKSSHTMAMFLHAFDDHLTDDQLPVTHLALLMRSQAWMIMNHANENLAKDIKKGEAIVHRFIDDYYSSITKACDINSLDGYCTLFKKQMATWLIVPILLAIKIHRDKKFTRSIQEAYTSFGIAWRLIDDLQDIEKDIVKGVHSSIYVCLNKELRNYWDHNTEKQSNQNKDFIHTILSYVDNNRVIHTIKDRICVELESAASIAASCGLHGFSNELNCLLKPLKNGRQR